jgi:hypothetical protein
MPDGFGTFTGPTKYSKTGAIVALGICIAFAVGCFVKGIPAGGVVFLVLAAGFVVLIAFGPRIRARQREEGV